MVYVEWNGDWCRRQKAKIEEAELFLFPLEPSNPAKLDGLCTKLIDGPSGGHAHCEPWKPGGKSMVLLSAARFSRIRSTDTTELKGYLDELDLAFFVPVELSVDGGPKEIFALNPYLYVDNPAGVIMGREIFGFPKVSGEIGWNPSILEFDLRTLVFKTNDATTPATQELVLSLKRSPVLSFLAPLLGCVSSTPISAGTVSSTVQALVQGVLQGLGVVAQATGFTSVRLPLLKQYRSVLPGNDAAFQEVVQGTFEIKSISAFDVYPRFLFWLSPLTLRLFGHASVDIADTLGLETQKAIKRAFRVVCELELEGKRLL